MIRESYDFGDCSIFGVPYVREPRRSRAGQQPWQDAAAFYSAESWSQSYRRISMQSHLGVYDNREGTLLGS